MIEALACGTPVIAFEGGSVPEIVAPGETGFIVNSVEEASDAARRLPEIDRRVCRETFERRFTAPRMASEYVRLYGEVIGRPGKAAVA
jgi:glycosyltransferase involved in cell wall biosynthesis